MTTMPPARSARSALVDGAAVEDGGAHGLAMSADTSDVPVPADTAIVVPSTPALKPADKDPLAVYLRGRACENSRRAMLAGLDACARALGLVEACRVSWEALRFAHAEGIRAVFVQDGHAPATVNLRLSALKGVVETAWKLGLVSAEDWQRVEAVKGVRGERLSPGRALAPDEVVRLFAAADALQPRARALRDSCILAVACACGLRRTELAQLPVEAYGSDGSLKVAGKGGRERLAWPSVNARARIEAWLAMRSPGAGALVARLDSGGRIVHEGGLVAGLSDARIRGILAELASAAGVAAFAPHDLRRTFISDLLDKADAVSVQKLAGHARLETTAKYDRRGERAKKGAAALVEIPTAPTKERT